MLVLMLARVCALCTGFLDDVVHAIAQVYQPVMFHNDANEHTAAVDASNRQQGTSTWPWAGAARHILAAANTLQRQHLVAIAVVLLAIPAAMIWKHMPMSQQRCQLLQQRFHSSAVLAGVQQQAVLAAAAAQSVQHSAVPELHILTIIGSNTPQGRVEHSPLLQSLPPALRHSVKVLRANTRIGHGFEGFGAFGAKIIEVRSFTDIFTS